jgi:hypothetical protein
MDAQQLFDTLAAESKVVGRALHKTEWIATAQRWLDGQVKRAPRKQNVLGKGLTDAQWLQTLADDPLFAGIDVAREAMACERHFRPCGITPSRKRIIGWLARADVKMQAQKQERRIDVYTEPLGWRHTAQTVFPETLVHEAQWSELGTDTRARILRAM